MAIDLLSGKPTKGNFARSSSMGALYRYPGSTELAPKVTVVQQSWWPGLIPLALGTWIIVKIIKHTK